MDENVENTNASDPVKETLVFLVEQEKVRGEEVAALNEKIDALYDIVQKQIIEPSVAAYKEEQFNDFNDKYGERLGKYDGTLQKAMNDPEYSASREAFNEYDALSDEDKKDVDMDGFVTGVEKGLEEYVTSIKESLGIPADEAVEIKDDGEGNTEVVADENGDGEPETPVEADVTEDKPAEEAPAEEKADEEPKAEDEGSDEEDSDEVDEDFQKEIDDWLKKH